MEEEKKILNLATKVAEELGTSPSDLIEKLNANRQRVTEMCKSDSGKCKVIGIDKFSGEDWIEGEYDSLGEAIRVARKKTEDAMKLASDSSVATVYYAYNSEGKYMGGNVWSDE